jgi:hypothetical protein
MACQESRAGYNQLMNKIIIPLFLIFFSFSALACKPRPMEACGIDDRVVDHKAFTQLLAKIKNYQGQLDRVIRYPEQRLSCFNSHFANYYGEAFLALITKTQGKTCTQNISLVEVAFKNLVSKDSLEYKSIPKAAREHFAEESEKLNREIQKFFKGTK